LIKGEEYVELADLLSGRKMAPFLKVLESIFGYMSEIIDQLNSSAERFDMIGLTRELVPALRNGRDAFARVKNMQEQLELMNREIGTMRKEFFLSQNMKSLLGHANDAAAEFAVFTRTMNRLEPQLSRAMHDLAKITPEMAKASPEFARIAEDSIKTLREMIVTMKAMQKSWFLRDHVKDARDEERMPAGQPSAPKGK
jgi:chromosome segregation ATPase